MPEIGPLPEPLNSSPVDFEKHWSILDQTKAEFKASGRSGVVIYVEADDAYRNKLAAFLARFNTKMDLKKPGVKPYLVIEHATQAKELFDLVIKSGLKAELIIADSTTPNYGGSASMREALEAELKLAAEVVDGVKQILSKHKFSDEEWSTTVIGFIAQGIEHHAAVLLLLRSKLIGSAFALVRSITEILVRGVWMTACATEAQIKKFRDHDKLDLSFGEMSDAIDTACGIEFFHDFKERSWKALNSYTHTGILQLGRRFTGHKVEPSYTEEEQIEVIKTSTVSILLLVRPFLMKHGQEEAAREIDELGERLNRKKVFPSSWSSLSA
jgi:hypothetical protein